MGQAITARLPWHAPKVRVLQWPVLVGPLWSFVIVIKDGVEYTFCSKPIVTRTTRKFDAPRLVVAITDYVEYRSFTCTDLKEYADELTHHIKKAEELRAVIGDITALELGRRLKSIEGENFGGYYVKHERRETEGVVWRIYPAM